MSIIVWPVSVHPSLLIHACSIFSAPSLNHLYIVVPYVGVTVYAASIWMFVRRKCWCFPSLTRDWPCSETWKNAVLQAYIEIAIVLVRCINWLAVGRGERFFLRSPRTLHSPSSSAKLALVAGIHDVSKHMQACYFAMGGGP